MTPFKRTQGRLAAYCFIGLAAVLSGCVNVGLQKKFPDIKTYVLDLSPQKHAVAGDKAVPVRLNNFSAVPAFADRYLTYRSGETAYEQDFYNQLLTSPAEMVRDQVLTWLKGSPRISFVLPMDSMAAPNCVIDGKILELYGDYRREESPKAVLKIQFTVSDLDPEKPRVLSQKIYSAEIPMERISPKELTEGWSTGLGQIMAEFENDIKN